MSDARKKPTKLAAQSSPALSLTPTAPASLRATARPSPAGSIEFAPAAPMQLGAIKELMQSFIRARQSAPTAKTELELRELYRFVCRQAQKAGIDPVRAMELHRAAAATRQPKLVRS
jgi:hypothetical protein